MQMRRCKRSTTYMSMAEDPSKLSLSFAGCGFLCIYHAGVCAAIKEYAPQLINNRMYGASAGSIVAAGLICNVGMSEAIIVMLKTVSKANSFALQTLSPNFDLIGIVKEGLGRMLPENAHELCSGRLFISLTRYRDFKNVVVNEFDTREELIQAILCSSFIPFYCGFQPPLYRGEAYCDGGLSDNQPIYDRHTITVSPFCGESDICPNDEDSASLLGVDFYNTSIRVTTNNLFRLFTTLFPPSLEICARICRQGFKDALVLLNKRGLAPCVRCLTYRANLLLMPQEELARVKSQTLVTRKSRRKLMSECENCFDMGDSNFQPTTDSLFPPILQKAIDDAKSTESRIFNYLNSFRVFRWSRRLIAPMFLPFDFTVLTLRTLYNTITSPNTTDFFVQRFYHTLDFVLAEIARNNLLYSSKISCQLAPLFDEQAKSPIIFRLKRSSEIQLLSKEMTDETQVDLEDSIQRLIEVSITHDDALVCFYTVLRTEVPKNPELNQRRLRPIHALKRPSFALPKSAHTIDTVPEIESPDSLSPTSNKAEDSGYTETESSTGNFAKRRKEANCSLAQNPELSGEACAGDTAPQEQANSPVKDAPKDQSLRQPASESPKKGSRASSRTAQDDQGAYGCRLLSSDSDVDGNCGALFVSSRQFNNSSYDGESDTDH